MCPPLSAQIRLVPYLVCANTSSVSPDQGVQEIHEVLQVVWWPVHREAAPGPRGLVVDANHQVNAHVLGHAHDLIRA